MSYQAWFEHFKEQLQGLTESFDQNGSNLSLLGYALKEQRLSSDVYLKWAMTHFNLPILQSRFFTETSLSQEMFAKWATHYPWSKECLPVAEWDGSLIIACLQPPQDFPTNPKSIYVLAAFENLQQAWSHLHPEKATRIENANIDDAPTGIDLSMATVTRQTPSDSFSFEDLGMEGTPQESSSDLISLDENSEGPSKPEESLEGLFDSPTVIRLESITDQKDSSSPEITLENDLFNEAQTAAITDVASNEIPEPEAEKPVMSLQQAPQEAPLKEPAPPTSVANNVVNKPATPRSTGIVKPTMNPVVMGNLALEKIKKKNAVLLGEKIKTILSQMKTQFEKSMILTLDDQETQVVAFAWDENFQDVKDTSATIPLKTPSIFNIVSSTQKAFHGYISPNKINENFFGGWNQGRIPEHVTITPILMNEKLVGMLMGFGTKATYNKISLNLAEKLSTDFVKGLQAA